MSPFLRKVPTASGATAVQVVRKWRGQRTVLEHVGSARTDTELAALVAVGQDRLAAYGAQEQFDPGLDVPDEVPEPMAERKVVGSASRVLIDAIAESYRRLGFAEAIEDEAFFHLVLTRLIEPTSKLDSIRVRPVVSPGWGRVASCPVGSACPPSPRPGDRCRSSGIRWPDRGALSSAASRR